MGKLRKCGGALLAIGILLTMAGGLNQLYGAAAGVPTIYKLLGSYALPVAIVGLIMIVLGIALIYGGKEK